MSATFDRRLENLVGRELGAPRPAQDPVNVPMIRHWVEAMGVTNPVHLDGAAARETGREGVVAPVSMVQAWTMRGYAATREPAPTHDGFAELVALLDEEGHTSVVATDSEFEFHRELVPGDHVSVHEVIESISPVKTTALGSGRFVTTLKTYRDQDGETVATQRWRTLRFRPAEPRASRPRRPRPAINRDNAFWFEAAREHRLVIQRCAACGALRHPPGPCCPECRSFDWNVVESRGRASVYSFVVNHHPRHPAFDHPVIVAVVDLEEGTRITTNLVDIAPERVEIGMPVELRWLDADPDLSLPVFAPAEREET